MSCRRMNVLSQDKCLVVGCLYSSRMLLQVSAGAGPARDPLCALARTPLFPYCPPMRPWCVHPLAPHVFSIGLVQILVLCAPL